MNKPTTKNAWKAVMTQYPELDWFFGGGKPNWLKYLPYHDEHGKPVKLNPPLPLVQTSREGLADLRRRLAAEKLHLAPSTVHAVEGYHHPKGTSVFALSRPCDAWWNERKLDDNGVPRLKETEE